MQCNETGPPHTGDSDDEIAELRIQALLTKRENEAEVSKPLGNSQPIDHQSSQRHTMSGYSGYGNSYNNGRSNYNFYRPPYRHNPYHPNFAGKTVNSSNIVVLTSSENDHTTDWRKQTQDITQRPPPYQPPVRPVNRTEQISTTSKLMLPQDKYSRPPPNISMSHDNKSKQMSARMKRLQGSDSESESDSDSSSESSSSSSDSDSSSSSDSSSNEDSDSELDGKVKKEKKLEKTKDIAQNNINNVQVKNSSKNLSTDKVNYKLKDEKLVSPKGKIDLCQLKEKEKKNSTRRESRSPLRPKLRNSRSLTPRRISPRYRSRSPRFKLGPSKFDSRSPKLRPWSPRRRSKSPRFRSRSPGLRVRSPRVSNKSPYRRSLSPRLRPLSPRFRSKSPMPRSKSPNPHNRSPWQRTGILGRRSFSPSSKSYRRSVSPYRQGLNKPSQRIRSPSPRFKSRFSRSPARRKVPFRSRSRSPLPRRLSPFSRRSPLQRMRPSSPYTRRRSPRLRSVSPTLTRRYSPGKPNTSMHDSRIMTTSLRPPSPRFKHELRNSPLRPVSPRYLKSPSNSYLGKPAGYSKLNEAPKFSHGLQRYRSRSPLFQVSRGPINRGRSQSPLGARGYYKENYDNPNPEFRQNQSQHNFQDKYPVREQNDSYGNSREIYSEANKMGRALSPWSRNGRSNFEHSSPNFSNSRPNLMPKNENSNSAPSNFRENNNRFPYAGRGRLLSHQAGERRPISDKRERFALEEKTTNVPIPMQRPPPNTMQRPPPNTMQRPPPNTMQRPPPILPLIAERLHDGKDLRQQRNAFENRASQIQQSNSAISPFRDPARSYKNCAGERHIPYSLFENELPKKSTIPSKSENDNSMKHDKSSVVNVDRKKETRHVSNRRSDDRPARHSQETSQRKWLPNRDSKSTNSRNSAVRNESKVSNSKSVSDKLRSNKASSKDRKSEADVRSHSVKRTSKSETEKQNKVSTSSKRKSSEKSSKINKLKTVEQPVNKDPLRIKEMSPKVKVPKGPRTPSYSPETETPVNREEWDKLGGSADVDKDIAALAEQRTEIERKLREEEETAAKDEEERIKNAKVKEERVLADRAKEIDTIHEEKPELDKGKEVLSDVEKKRSDQQAYTKECRSQKDDSYLNYTTKLNSSDNSFEGKDKRSDSKYDLQPDFFNISDAEFSRNVSLEQQVDIAEKKPKKEKLKKKKSKEKKESKHKKTKDKKKKKEKKRKKEHVEKHKKKDRDNSISPRRYKMETDVRKKIHKHSRSDEEEKKSPRLSHSSARKIRRNDSAGDSYKRKRSDDGERTRIEKKPKLDPEPENRRNRCNKTKTDKAILVTVGKGADRLVTSGKKSFKAKYKPSESSHSSKLPVHMRLGPSKGSGKEKDRSRPVRSSTSGRDRSRRR